jgi:gluconate 2-dehydrogenase gamma chain
MKRVGISPGRRAFLRSVASAGRAAVAIGAGVADEIVELARSNLR